MNIKNLYAVDLKSKKVCFRWKNTYIRKMIDVAHARQANLSLIPLIKLFILPSSGLFEIKMVIFDIPISRLYQVGFFRNWDFVKKINYYLL